MRPTTRSTRRILAPALGLFLLAGCATTPGADRLAQRDPLEGFNRAVWDVNQGVDKVVLKPVTQAYRAVVPTPARRGVSNFFSNLGEPFSFINNMLQGKPKRAVRNLGRFVVNTTIGVAGLADPATKMGIKPAPEDLGQTLAVWGVNAGPYLVLPLLGPSTLRDGVGTGTAQLVDPYNVCLRDCGLPNGTATAATVATVINGRSQLIDSGADSFLASSADAYATARSAYLQRRRGAIVDAEEGDASVDANPGASDDSDFDEALGEIGADPGTAAAPSADGVHPADTPAAGDLLPPAAGPAPAADEAPRDPELDAALGEIDAESDAGTGTEPAADPATGTPPAPTR